MKTKKDDLRRDGSREGLKVKGRSGRAAAAIRPRRNDILPSLKVEPFPVDALKSYSRKLRTSDSAHVQEIANSISTLGFNIPLLIGKDNIVLDGESRLEAAKLLGLSSVPCIRVDHLDETEQRLLRIAVNRLAEKGSWDVGELKVEFEELIIADAPIEISGFGSDEIDQIVIGRDQDQSETKDRSEAAVLAPPIGTSAIARVGDLFLLGQHRAICGNATDPDLVKRLMQTDVARMVFTDAPFHVAIGGPVAASERQEGGTASVGMTDAQFLEFNQNWMNVVFPHLVDGGLLGAFIDWRDLPMAHAAATALGLTPVDLVVWANANAVTDGGLYQSQHRMLPLFKKGSAVQINNSSDGPRGRHRTNLWTYPAASFESPTVQSTSILGDALSDLTNRGEIVLDPFLGSGSTLIAAQNTGRVCCGVEFDPLYIDVIIRRYEASTGTAAVLADSGETFDQVATRRLNDERR